MEDPGLEGGVEERDLTLFLETDKVSSLRSFHSSSRAQKHRSILTGYLMKASLVREPPQKSAEDMKNKL